MEKPAEQESFAVAKLNLAWQMYSKSKLGDVNRWDTKVFKEEHVVSEAETITKIYEALPKI